MATDDNGTEESTLRDMLTQGRDTARARTDDLREEGKQRAGELSDRTQEGYTSMLECAKAEDHLWYQMWSVGSEMFTDAGKALLGSTPSELKSKGTLGYVGGLLGGTFISVLSLPALIVEETVRYAVKKRAEKK